MVANICGTLGMSAFRVLYYVVAYLLVWCVYCLENCLSCHENYTIYSIASWTTGRELCMSVVEVYRRLSIPL